MAGNGMLTVEPVLGYPSRAEAGRRYLFTVDVRTRLDSEWPDPSREEIAVRCLVSAWPLFECETSQQAVVAHRFGGTYGPARFLLEAAALDPGQTERRGKIRVTLVSESGMMLTSLETPEISVVERRAERKPERDRAKWGHDAPVTALAISPDGRRVVSASSSGAWRIWDLATEKLLAVPTPHTTALQSVAFSSDGLLVAAGGSDGTGLLHHCELGWTKPISLHSGVVWSLCFGEWFLASVSSDMRLILWDLERERWEVLRTFPDWVVAVGYLRETYTVFAACDDGTLHHIELNGPKHTTGWKAPARINCMAVVQDTKEIVCGLNDGSIRIWKHGEPDYQTILTDGGSIHSIAASGDGRWIASGHDDGSVGIFDRKRNKHLARPYFLSGLIRAQSAQIPRVAPVALSPDGRVALAGTETGAIERIDILPPDPVSDALDVMRSEGPHERRFEALRDLLDYLGAQRTPPLRTLTAWFEPHRIYLEAPNLPSSIRAIVEVFPASQRPGPDTRPPGTIPALLTNFLSFVWTWVDHDGEPHHLSYELSADREPPIEQFVEFFRQPFLSPHEIPQDYAVIFANDPRAPSMPFDRWLRDTVIEDPSRMLAAHDPDLREFEHRIETIIAYGRQAKRPGTLYIYFVGVGRNSDAPAPMFRLSDGSMVHFMDYVRRIQEDDRFQRIVVLADLREEMHFKGPPIMAGPASSSQLYRSSVVGIFSCQPAEGRFTHDVIGALGGRAAERGRAEIRAESLRRYMVEKQQAEHLDRVRYDTVLYGSDFPIRGGVLPPVVTVRIRIPEHFTDRVALMREDTFSMEMSKPVNEIDLAPGRYTLRCREPLEALFIDVPPWQEDVLEIEAFQDADPKLPRIVILSSEGHHDGRRIFIEALHRLSARKLQVLVRDIGEEVRNAYLVVLFGDPVRKVLARRDRSPVFWVSFFGQNPAKSTPDFIAYPEDEGSLRAAARAALERGDLPIFDAERLFESARRSVVRVESSQPVSFASGFVLGRASVVTADYVTNDNLTIWEWRGENKYQVRHVLASRAYANLGYGILVYEDFDKAPIPRLKHASKMPEIGERALVVGWNEHKELTGIEGTVESMDELWLDVSIPHALPGFGGCPVLNANGEALGLLHSERERASARVIEKCVRLDRINETAPTYSSLMPMAKAKGRKKAAPKKNTGLDAALQKGRKRQSRSRRETPAGPVLTPVFGITPGRSTRRDVVRLLVKGKLQAFGKLKKQNHRGWTFQFGEISVTHDKVDSTANPGDVIRSIEYWGDEQLPLGFTTGLELDTARQIAMKHFIWLGYQSFRGLVFSDRDNGPILLEISWISSRKNPLTYKVYGAI